MDSLQSWVLAQLRSGPACCPHAVRLLPNHTCPWLAGCRRCPCCCLQICNHVCSSVDSVPFHKVFAGFGKTSSLQYLSAIQVLDAGSKQWSAAAAAGAEQPCGREDTAWVWDAKSCSLVLFGGWSSRWLGDTWRADASTIIGPGYACLAASPAIGPVAGGTDVTISGLRFRCVGWPACWHCRPGTWQKGCWL